MKTIVTAQRYQKGQSIKKALKGLLKPLGGIERFIDKGDRVLIKPNINIATKKPGVNTNPKIVETLIELLNQAGAREVALGEGSGAESTTKECFEVVGYNEIAESKGAKLIDFDNVLKKTLTIPNGIVLKDIEGPKALLDYDILINVPVLKTNICTVITASIKNLLGIASKKDKVKAHLLGLSEALVDIHKVIKPELNIVDATTCMEGFGPISGQTREIGLLMAGKQALSLDTVASKLIGANPQVIRHLMIAYQEGLGTIDMDQIEVKGANLSKENLNFKLPPQKLPKYDGIKLLLGKNCGDCIGPYAIALTRMEKKGLIESLKGYTVLIGKHTKHKDKKSIAIGRCSENLKGSVSCYVPGCPPTGLLIEDQIKFSLGLEKEPSIYLKIWRKYIEEIESSRHPN